MTTRPRAPRASKTTHDTTIGLREQKKREVRARLVEVAAHLFESEGYAATSVERIALEAGVSLPTLFRYFATKADLLFEGAEDVVEEWRHAISEGPAGEPLATALRRATHAIAFSTRRRGSAAALRARLAPEDAELRRKALEIDARVIGRIADTMGELLGLDPREDPRPYLVAACAMSTVRSAQFVLGHAKRPGTLARRIDEAFDALDGLGALLTTPRAARRGFKVGA
jgi:AcrR family transcriptional regulator